MLDGVDVHNQILEMFPDYISRLINTYLDSNKPYFEWDLEPLNNALEDKLFPKNTNLISKEFVEDCEPADVKDKLLKVFYAKMDEKKESFEKLNLKFADFERFILLRVVDRYWMDHIDQMEILKKEIRLRAYGQQDPIVAYKNEGFDLFDTMIESIQEDTCASVLNSTIEVKQSWPTQQPFYTPVNVIENGKVGQAKSQTADVGRNEPCPCGSGKKFKNCCGK